MKCDYVTLLSIIIHSQCTQGQLEAAAHVAPISEQQSAAVQHSAGPVSVFVSEKHLHLHLHLMLVHQVLLLLLLLLALELANLETEK